MSVIGRIALQPATVRPGEPVRVEVFDLNDNSLAFSPVQVKVNGVPGAVQYLQFPSIGQRRIIIGARTPEGDMDQQVALLDVAGLPLEFRSLDNQNDIALISVTQSTSQPYTAVLTLGSLVDVRSPHPLCYDPSATPHWSFARAFSTDSVAVRLASRGVLGRAMSQNRQGLIRIETSPLGKTRARESVPVAEGNRAINSAGRTYKWGGEVRVEYTITVGLLVNKTIDVHVQGTLYEGTSEDTDDLDGTGGVTFQAAGSTLTITNTDEDDDDAGVLTISVKNVRNNN